MFTRNKSIQEYNRQLQCLAKYRKGHVTRKDQNRKGKDSDLLDMCA